MLKWIHTAKKYGLLTKREVKMAGYWQSSLFACLWTEMKSRSINSQKKERGQYPAILTKQTWSIKDSLYGFWGNFACGIQRVVPSVQDGSILPARVANHSAIWFILPVRGTSHIIKRNNAPVFRTTLSKLRQQQIIVS